MAYAISILHLAGPQVPASALIYLKSSVYPLGPEFATPYSVAAGGITGSTWNLGQTWYLTAFAGKCTTNLPNDYCNPILPDNITVYIISGSALLFSVIVPGAVNNIAPTFVSVSTTPSAVAVGEAFTVSAVIQGVTSANSVEITDTGVPGLTSAAQAMTYSSTTGAWSYPVTAGLTTTAGSFFAFITASNTNGQTGTAAVPVTVTSFSTQISTALNLTTVSTPAKCTGTQNPVAACYLTGGSDYYFTVTIHSSLITFGSVLFQVVNTAAPRGTFSATHVATFALSLSASATTEKTPNANWTSFGSTTSTQPMAMPSSGFTYYESGYSTTTALLPTGATGGFIISVDIGTGTPLTTLMLVATATGAYSGQVSVAIP